MNRSRPSRREVSERLRADVPVTPADDPFVATLAHVAASGSTTRGASATAVRTLRTARGFKVAAASAAVAVVMAGGAYAAARVDRDRPAAPAPATDGSTLHGEDLLPVDSDRPDQTGDDDALEVEDQTTVEHDDSADHDADDQDGAAAHSDDHVDEQGEQGEPDDQQAGLSDGPDADGFGPQQVAPPKGHRDGTGTRDHQGGDDTSDDADDTDSPESDGAEDSDDAEDPGDTESEPSDDGSDDSEAGDGGSGDASDDGSSGETDSTID